MFPSDFHFGLNCETNSRSLFVSGCSFGNHPINTIARNPFGLRSRLISFKMLCRLKYRQHCAAVIASNFSASNPVCSAGKAFQFIKVLIRRLISLQLRSAFWKEEIENDEHGGAADEESKMANPSGDYISDYRICGSIDWHLFHEDNRAMEDEEEICNYMSRIYPLQSIK